MDKSLSSTSPDAPAAATELQVNGESKTCPVGTTLLLFLEQIKLNSRLIAIEYNGEILTRALWSETVLQTNDQLEIVTIVGGG